MMNGLQLKECRGSQYFEGQEVQDGRSSRALKEQELREGRGARNIPVSKWSESSRLRWAATLILHILSYALVNRFIYICFRGGRL